MTRRARWIGTLFCTILLATGMIAARAQETTGSISGTITDKSGAAIKGATVVLTNTDRGQDVRTLTTNSTGYYTGTSLPLGTYTVKILDNGFKTEAVTGLVLHVNDALTVSRMLVAGSTNETVTVTADALQVNLQDATQAGLINGAQMRELVLSNRNFEQLVMLQPGVAYGNPSDQLFVGATAPSGTSNQAAFSVNGGRSTSNNWMIDGADNVDRGSGLTLLMYPSVDAISEFKVLRGQYTAEFGRAASGQVNIVTRSGTNQFHGDAFEFWRNDILNGNDYFNNLTGKARAPYRYHDFGGVLGGPVLIPKIYNGRDKTFFFFSYEGRRFINYTSGTAYVPTAAERAGDFSNSYYSTTSGSTTTYTQGPIAVCTAYNTSTGVCTAAGTKIPTINAQAAAYLKDLYSIVPLPTSAADIAAGLDPHAVRSSARNVFNNDQYIARVDQQFGKRLSVFYRYIHDSLPVISGVGTFTSVPLPGVANTSTRQPGTTHMGHGTYIFTPSLLLDMGYSYSSGAILTDPIGGLTTANSPDVQVPLAYPNQLGVIPTLAFTNGFTSLGSTGIYRDYNIDHNAFGNITKTLRNHTLIFGGTYNHYQKKENSTGGNQGALTFQSPSLTGLTPPAGSTVATGTGILAEEGSFAAFLLGDVNGATAYSQSSNAIVADIQENIFEGFVQDNFKVSPRLTLNLGLRYSFFQQPTDGQSRISNFDPAKYSAAKAPAIGTDGGICLATNATTCLGITPNPNTDFYGPNYINGMIFATGFVPGHDSQFGKAIGSPSNNNFAPRIGFALDVFGNGKTALRGGYGIVYDESSVSFYELQVLNNPPAVTNCSIGFRNLDQAPVGCPSLNTGTPGTTPGRLVASPINYHTPYIQQYSLGVQHQIMSNFLIDVGYVGNHGTHLLGLVDIDEAQPNAFVGTINPLAVSSGCKMPDTGLPALLNSTCDKAINRIRPYLGYFAIDAVRSIFSSNYNALQVKATKRFSGQSLVDVNYTWSRNLTNGQNDYSTPPQNTYDIDADYGRATYDRSQILTADYIWELPWYKDQKGLIGHVLGGWETSGIVAVNSGVPLTVTASTTTAGSQIAYGYTSVYNNRTDGSYVNDSVGLGINGNTNAGFRPDMIGNPNKAPAGHPIHTRQEWFYKGAFAAAPPSVAGALSHAGNERRGVIEGPGFWRWDAGLFRNFKIHEGLDLQLRAEATNVLNHTNWAGTAGSAGTSSTYIGLTSTTSSTFAAIQGARDARILQFAGKLRF